MLCNAHGAIVTSSLASELADELCIDYTPFEQIFFALLEALRFALVAQWCNAHGAIVTSFLASKLADELCIDYTLFLSDLQALWENIGKCA